MASFIPTNGPAKEVKVPLTLTALQTYVGGFIKFIELPSGDLLVVNEAGPSFAEINEQANGLAGRVGPIYGHAVLCSPSEIE